MKWGLFFQIVILLLLVGTIFYFLELGEKPLEPRIVTRTPTETIKSYIRIKKYENDIANRSLTNVIKKYYSQIYTEEQLKLFEDSFAEATEERERFFKGLRIDTINQETDYRVTVFFSEPPFIESDERERKKLTLLKSNGVWKIDRILESCFACEGTGKVEDHEEIMEIFKKHRRWEKIEKLCEICKGTGWTKRVR